MEWNKAIEKLAYGLSIFSFVLICVLTQKSLSAREQCLNSTFLSFVQIGPERIENCRFESRLNLRSWFFPRSRETLEIVRQLELLEPVKPLFADGRPRLAVDVSLSEPHQFELGHGYVRLGRAWLNEPSLTRRALIMGLLKRDHPQAYASPFLLETMSDFLALMADTETHAVALKFPLSSPSFASYCRSPYRSLAHYEDCSRPEPDSLDLESRVWGLEPLLARGLRGTFNRLDLKAKLEMIQAIRDGQPMPGLPPLKSEALNVVVAWFKDALRAQVNAFTPHQDGAVQSTLKELEVEAPTHWELTVDLTKTPAWKEILQQLKTYSLFRKTERTLVFTPDGEIALPSGLAVSWPVSEISSQKHVLIACTWPKPGEAVNVTARHLFAQQNCGKVAQVFWN